MIKRWGRRWQSVRKNNRKQHVIPSGTINTEGIKINAPKPKEFYIWFLETFDTAIGKKVLDHLDKYSRRNFPNYENVNATFSKIGEQTLVEYIRAVIVAAKKGTGIRARVRANRAAKNAVRK